MDRRRELPALDEVQLVRLGALARDLGAGLHVDRLERAREARQAHAIEIAEVRNESEECLEGVIAGIGHGARRLAPASRGDLPPRGSADPLRPGRGYAVTTCLTGPRVLCVRLSSTSKIFAEMSLIVGCFFSPATISPWIYALTDASSRNR